MSRNESSLFQSTVAGDIPLANRIVMAPMTRSRALGNVPNALMAAYYASRADAGLIVTEGTAPAPEGLGYARIPGLFTEAQIEGWRHVTDAVHARGGRIVVQLMHTGRIGHPANLPAGAELLAPSAVAAAGEIWTDAQGMQPHPVPKAMDDAAIRAARDAFVASARAAMRAGFDGVELHAANGYLLGQFLNPGTNRRTDAYGGDIRGRSRFVLEVAEAVAAAIGPGRVGIRLSPYNPFNDLAVYAGEDADAVQLAGWLGRLKLAYLHVIASQHPDAPADLLARMRSAFGGTFIANGGYDRARAEVDLDAGRADLIAFGRPFVANPDFVRRLAERAPLAELDPGTLYTPGERGYTDYPTLAAAAAA